MNKGVVLLAFFSFLIALAIYSPSGTGSIYVLNAPSSIRSTSILSNDTGSIGGGLLTTGSCTSGTTTIQGATVGNVAIANPDTYPGDGTIWLAYVSSANIVTVKECAIVSVTPSASVYHVRVIA